MILGVDVGGTRVKAGVLAGETLRDFQVFPRPDTPDALARELRRRFGDLSHLKGAGLAIAGLVQDERVIQAPNLPRSWWHDRETYENLLGLPVKMENDVNAALVGEMMAGKGKGAASAVLVALGTGVGGALWLKGGLWKGGGLAGEVGHMPLDPLSGPVCRCGNRGCVEAYLGEWAVVQWIETNRTQGRIPAWIHTPKDLATHEDPRIQAFWDHYGTVLGQVMVALLHLLDVERVLVGGGLSRAWPRFAPAMRKALERMLLSQETRRFTVEPVSDPEKGGVLGAALLFKMGGDA